MAELVKDKCVTLNQKRKFVEEDPLMIKEG